MAVHAVGDLEQSAWIDFAVDTYCRNGRNYSKNLRLLEPKD